jgi:hypothetical protein
MQAPGQLLKHYAPYLPCYYLLNQSVSEEYENPSNQHRFALRNAAFISFDSKFDEFEKSCKYYFKVGSNIPEEQSKQIE